ncbi:MAG: hypothetical protein Q8S55_14340 [Methylococcaceae bacterium]|nr:hypothetical protein [Methylococcaceae bacterium]
MLGKMIKNPEEIELYLAAIRERYSIANEKAREDISGILLENGVSVLKLGELIGKLMSSEILNKMMRIDKSYILLVTMKLKIKLSKSLFLLRKKLKGGAIDALMATIKTFSLNHTKQASDTPPTTITLSTLRTSAAIFRRVGICA